MNLERRQVARRVTVAADDLGVAKVTRLRVSGSLKGHRTDASRSSAAAVLLALPANWRSTGSTSFPWPTNSVVVEVTNSAEERDCYRLQHRPLPHPKLHPATLISPSLACPADGR